MKTKLLLVEKLDNSPVERAPLLSPYWSCFHNLVFILQDAFDLYSCGYHYDGRIEVNFDATLRLVYGGIKEWFPRPIIFIPDHSAMYDITELNTVDAVIANNPVTARDAQIFGKPCLYFYLPVFLEAFRNIQWTGHREYEKLLVFNKSLNDILEPVKALFATGFNILTYTHAADEINSVWLEVCSLLKNVIVINHTTWEDFASITYSKFGVCNIYRPITVGRIATMSAFAKSISIGYPQSYNEYLYPYLTSFDWEVLSQRLLEVYENRELYNEIADYAHGRLLELDVSNTKRNHQLIDFIRGQLP